MIIIKLQGGLGNQLFQYALGRTIEKKYKKEVAYDLSFFNNQQKLTPRTYCLDKYNTKLRIASGGEISKTKYAFGIFSKISYFIKKALNKFFFKKYHISYESDFLESLKDNNSLYLEGYWQSFRYVEPCIEELGKEITLKDATSHLFEDIVEKILKSESVAIHIRRGDYLKTGGDLATLDISYYERANNFVSQKLKNIQYYIFTDDVIWAKENLQFLGKENIVFVSDIGLNDYEELLLITKCKSVFIANSSYSWWGAVLNSNENAIIVCPKDWRNKLLKNDDNLCPKEWIRM